MTRVKVVVGSVLYSQAIRYAHDFFCSIGAQEECDFELLLVCDNLKSEELELCRKLSKSLRSVNTVNIVQVDQLMSIARLRVLLLEEAKKRDYDLLIMGDFDDTFSTNRVKENINQYDKKYSFFYNDLYLDSNKQIMKNMPNEVNDIWLIEEQNFVGLSNSAINIKCISEEFIRSLKNIDLEVFDWYLYSRILLDGGCGKKILNCKTIYRQHENNIIGINNTYDINSLNKEISTKITHYQNLSRYSQRFAILKEKYKSIEINEKILLDKCINQTINGFWWEKIKIKR